MGKLFQKKKFHFNQSSQFIAHKDINLITAVNFLHPFIDPIYYKSNFNFKKTSDDNHTEYFYYNKDNLIEKKYTVTDQGTPSEIDICVDRELYSYNNGVLKEVEHSFFSEDKKKYISKKDLFDENRYDKEWTKIHSFIYEENRLVKSIITKKSSEQTNISDSEDDIKRKLFGMFPDEVRGNSIFEYSYDEMSRLNSIKGKTGFGKISLSFNYYKNNISEISLFIRDQYTVNDKRIYKYNNDLLESERRESREKGTDPDVPEELNIQDIVYHYDSFQRVISENVSYQSIIKPRYSWRVEGARMVANDKSYTNEDSWLTKYKYDTI